MANEKRLIDANVLLEAYWEEQKKPGSYSVERMIMQVPTVDAVEVVHGRWELVEHQSSPFGVDQEFQCSICGTPTDEEWRTRYCPNCGARMDGERKDDERKAD